MQINIHIHKCQSIQQNSKRKGKNYRKGKADEHKGKISAKAEKQQQTSVTEKAKATEANLQKPETSEIKTRKKQKTQTNRK